jgi:hypothetical protein
MGFAANGGLCVEHMFRVVLVFDGQQTVVVVAIKGCLPTWLVRIGLYTTSCQPASFFV